MAIMCCSQLRAINGSGTTKTMYGYTNSNILAGSGRSRVVAVVDKNGYTRYYPFYWTAGGLPSYMRDTGLRLRTSDSFTGCGVIVYPNVNVYYTAKACSLGYGVSCMCVRTHCITVDLNATMCNCVDVYVYRALYGSWAYMGRLGAGATCANINNWTDFTICSGYSACLRVNVINRSGQTVATCTMTITCGDGATRIWSTYFGNASQWGTS